MGRLSVFDHVEMRGQVDGDQQFVRRVVARADSGKLDTTLVELLDG